MRGFIYRNKSVFNFFKIILLNIRFLKALVKKDSNIYKNKPIISSIEIKDDSMHCFYGYYNKSIFSESDSEIIFHKINKKSNQNAAAVIALYNIDTGLETTIGNTNAWNWQQGSMLEWSKKVKNSIYYNDYNEEYGYHLVNFDTLNLTTVNYSMPFYCINHKEDQYLSLNFERLQVLAAGYGYPLRSKETFEEKDDGIWVCDMDSGITKLLISLTKLKHLFLNFNQQKNKCYVNHLEYVPNSNNFIFIFRSINSQGIFSSKLIIFDSLNNEFKILIDTGHVSHFCWKNETELFIYSTINSFKSFYTLDVYSKLCIGFEGDCMPEDGHPSFDKTKRYLINDTYPNDLRKQYLYMYDFVSKKRSNIAVLKSPIKFFDENRCDLHPRWSNDGKTICIDNTSENIRTLKLLKIF
jgi:hypothetical protein